MNISTNIHPNADTSMMIMRWENSDHTPGRSILLDGNTSIHIREPEAARKMAELLSQVANELETLRNGKARGITIESEPDAHNGATVPLYLHPQPAPDVAVLVEALESAKNLIANHSGEVLPDEYAGDQIEQIDAAIPGETIIIEMPGRSTVSGNPETLRMEEEHFDWLIND